MLRHRLAICFAACLPLTAAGFRASAVKVDITHLRQFAAEDPCNSLILLAGAVSDAKM
jgi:hypothetical protein